MNNIISEIAVLIEDLNLLIARLNESDRTNNKLPIDVYRRAVTTSLNTLENEYDIDLQGFNEDWLRYGVENHFEADREEMDESVEGKKKRAKMLRRQIRNGTFEIPKKMKVARKL